MPFPSPTTFPTPTLFPGPDPARFPADAPHNTAAELYQQLTPLVAQYGDPLNSSAIFATAIGTMFAELDALVRDQNGAPGWSQALDLTRADDSWLRWLGQFVGYFVPLTSTNWDRERERIVTRSSHRRGSIPIMREVVQEHLSGDKTVVIRERDTSAHHMSVYIYASQIATTAAKAEAAARSQKAAGLVMDFVVLSGGDWNTLVASQATWNTVTGKFADWNEVISNPSKP